MALPLTGQQPKDTYLWLACIDGGGPLTGTAKSLMLGDATELPIGFTNLGATLTGTLTISGNTTVGGTLGVTGAVTLGAALGVTGLATLASLLVSGNAEVSGILTVGGVSNLASLSVTGNAAVGGTLGVTGAATLASAAVTGNATVGGTLGVTGAATLASAGVTGNATVGGTLGVTGAATLASAGVTGNATVGGTLGVTGVATVGGLLLSDTVWDDLRITSGGFERAGSSDPSQVDWQPGGSGATLKVWEFAKNDEIFVSAQMPHAYKPETDLQVHLHWSPRQYGVAQRGNTVGWKVDITAANYNAAFPATVTLDISHAVPAAAADHSHLITASATFTVPSGFKESGMVMMRVYRSDTGADDTWSETLTGRLPILLEVDLHYQINKIGSSDEIPD